MSDTFDTYDTELISEYHNNGYTVEQLAEIFFVTVEEIQNAIKDCTPEGK